MATSYKTPGVYIEEISKFPPSVAQVETAVPAFIGYTEKAEYLGEDLLLLPTRINSLLEFEVRFGKGPKIDVSKVNLDSSNSVKSVTVNSTYYLYDSLRMFFNNGGGSCYIVSVGKYAQIPTIEKSALKSGLERLKKADEPTLIVYPDGIALSAGDLYNGLYKDTLEQCYKLKDRFLIGDIKMKDSTNKDVDFANDIDVFRQQIGMQNLAYGAVYYPYLKVNLQRIIKYRDIKGKVSKLGTTVDWSTYIDASDTTTQNLLDDLNNIVDTLAGKMEPDMENYLKTHPVALDGVNVSDLEDIYLALQNDFLTKASESSTTVGVLRTAYKKIIEFIYAVAYKFLDEYAVASAIKEPISSNLKSKIDELVSDFDTLVKIDNSSVSLVGTSDAIFDDNSRSWSYTGPNNWNAIFDGGNADDNLFSDNGSSADEKRKNNMIEVGPLIKDVFYKTYATITEVYDDAKAAEEQKEASLILSLPVLKNTIDKLKTEHFTLPPSGAVAGIYAKTDATRGVWKAPANLSLASVIGPATQVTNNDQDRLNVDVDNGKSINAIRAFTGKGTMVWGARTLAGNDNEWRYISVRRFFNMVEESVKKATSQFVFEPNDANTWVKVRAMIENFLTLQWRAGALTGAKQDQAFYVRVGLGQTMTAEDILKGYMHVEIGMAVVRPAEFIVLKFSHKMQES
jgi:phage tail sheath protein FI